MRQIEVREERRVVSDAAGAQYLSRLDDEDRLPPDEHDDGDSMFDPSWIEVEKTDLHPIGR